MWYRRECLFTLSSQPRAVATRQTNFEFINNWCHKFQPLLSLPHTPGAAPHLADLSRPSDLFLFYQLPVPLPSSTASSANSQKKKNCGKKINKKFDLPSAWRGSKQTAHCTTATPAPAPSAVPAPAPHPQHPPLCNMCKRVPPLLDSPTIKGSDASGQMSPKRFLNSLATRASAEVNEGDRERGMATPGQLPRVVAPRATRRSKFAYGNKPASLQGSPKSTQLNEEFA